MQKQSSKPKSVKVVATENDFNSKEVSEPGMFSYSQPFFSQVREALLNRGSQSALRMWGNRGATFQIATMYFRKFFTSKRRSPTDAF